jgi:hypothetical protein
MGEGASIINTVSVEAYQASGEVLACLDRSATPERGCTDIRLDCAPQCRGHQSQQRLPPLSWNAQPTLLPTSHPAGHALDGAVRRFQGGGAGSHALPGRLAGQEGWACGSPHATAPHRDCIPPRPIRGRCSVCAPASGQWPVASGQWPGRCTGCAPVCSPPFAAGKTAAGIRVNAVAPGPVLTPLVTSTFSGEMIATVKSQTKRERGRACCGDGRGDG